MDCNECTKISTGDGKGNFFINDYISKGERTEVAEKAYFPWMFCFIQHRIFRQHTCEGNIFL